MEKAVKSLADIPEFAQRKSVELAINVLAAAKDIVCSGQETEPERVKLLIESECSMIRTAFLALFATNDCGGNDTSPE